MSNAKIEPRRSSVLKQVPRLSIAFMVGVIVLLCILPDNVFPDEKTWFGYITIHLSGSYEKTIDKSHKNKKDIQEKKYHLNAGVYIQTCIAAEAWSQGVGTYNRYTEFKHEWKNDHELCLNERARVKNRVKPGDFYEYRSTFTGEKVADAEPTVALYIAEDGQYSLICGGGAVYEYKLTCKSIMKYACSGKVDEPKSNPITGQTIWGQGHVAQGMVSGSIIEGEKWEDYKEWVQTIKAEVPMTSTVTWFLTTDSCAYVRNELEAAKKARDLYLKVLEEIEGKQINGDEFDRRVKRKAGIKFSPMGTEAYTCIWIPGEKSDQLKYLDQDDIRKKYYRCLPDVIFESDIAHEKWHQKTCREYRKCSIQSKGRYTCEDPFGYWEYTNDPVNYARDEVGAYDAKIGILMDWLKENCE